MRCKGLVLVFAGLVFALVATTSVAALEKPAVVSVLVLPEGFTPLTADLDPTGSKQVTASASSAARTRGRR